jgi:type II secretory pathway component GspD/PulD (secretin)
MFRVDTNYFPQTLLEAFPQIPAPQAATNVLAGGAHDDSTTNHNHPESDWVKRCFVSLGILTDKGSFLIFNERTGDVLVKDNIQELDLVERVMELLNKAPPGPASLEARSFHVDTNNLLPLLQRMPMSPADSTNDITQTNFQFAITDRESIPNSEHTPSMESRMTYPAVGGSAPSAGGLYSSHYSFPLRNYFASLGINVTTEGAFALYNQHDGDLLVSATPQDLDKLERAIKTLNKAPRQVRLDVKFALLDETFSKGVNFGWDFGNLAVGRGAVRVEEGSAPSYHGTPTVNNPSGIFPGPGPAGSNPGQMAPSASDTTVGSDPGTNAPFELRVAPAAAPATGILSGPQFRLTIQAIEQREGAKILSTPGITTDSGRKASLSLTNLLDAASGAPVAATLIVPGATSNRVVEDPVVDVLPTVLADGYVIRLDLAAFGRANVGYDKSAQLLPPSNGGSSQQAVVSALSAPRLPSSRNYSITNSVNVWDGQTFMLGGLIVESHPAQKKPTNSQLQNLMVFITPRIVDSAGNPVHPDDELKDFQNNIPPQPTVSPPK